LMFRNSPCMDSGKWRLESIAVPGHGQRELLRPGFQRLPRVRQSFGHEHVLEEPVAPVSRHRDAFEPPLS
jgi:hypothetical protein